MVKWSHKYFNFNGDEITGEFYFNLTEAEIIEMEFSKDGGYDAFLKKLGDQKNVRKIVPMIKEFLLKAYGEKSDDGNRFMKSDKISNDFAATNAYSDLYMKLATDAEFASKFMNALTPNPDQHAYNVVNL